MGLLLTPRGQKYAHTNPFQVYSPEASKKSGKWTNENIFSLSALLNVPHPAMFIPILLFLQGHDLHFSAYGLDIAGPVQS